MGAAETGLRRGGRNAFGASAAAESPPSATRAMTVSRVGRSLGKSSVSGRRGGSQEPRPLARRGMATRLRNRHQDASRSLARHRSMQRVPPQDDGQPRHHHRNEGTANLPLECRSEMPPPRLFGSDGVLGAASRLLPALRTQRSKAALRLTAPCPGGVRRSAARRLEV